SRGYQYSGSSNLGDVAWYDGNSSSTTHPVKTKSPNELGIYDMSGNVFEWCQDWYGSSYYSSSPQNNPMGPSSGSDRVLRGGGWSGNARGCRSTSRISVTPVNGIDIIGLRLAL
ncbi:MAG: formylglycine-generating enzyme family protein, partial [Alloprevotella sp.]